MNSLISNGNMHPNLAGGNEWEAQANYDRFLADSGYEGVDFYGLRIDPAWKDGGRIADCTACGASPNSVACDDRIPAHAAVAARDIGLFTLSADCFPLRISTLEHHSLAHIGWRSVDSLLPQRIVGIFRGLGYAVSSLAVELGPGLQASSNIIPELAATQLAGRQAQFWKDYVRYCTASDVSVDLQGAIIAQLLEAGVSFTSIDIDARDTYTDPDLFSRRASMATGKPRGNFVYLAPPAK